MKRLLLLLGTALLLGGCAGASAGDLPLLPLRAAGDTVRAAAYADLDDPATLLRYCAMDSYTADLLEQDEWTFRDEMYGVDSWNTTLEFERFSGRLLLREYDLWFEREISLEISAHAEGSWKIVLLAGDDNVLLTASSWEWQRASRPLTLPPGTTRVLLVGEGATGGCVLKLSEDAI